MKRALGATGNLHDVDVNSEPDSEWPQFDNKFNNSAHPKIVRHALRKVATAAIDLSGFARWRERQWSMHSTGMRLLTHGLAQLWEGLSTEERLKVHHHLKTTHKAAGWPSSPDSEPGPYAGPDDFPPADEYRVINNYTACYPGFVMDSQLSMVTAVEERQEKALRQATLHEFIAITVKALKAIDAMVQGKYDSPQEWGKLYNTAFWGLKGLSRADEIGPREEWPAEANEQRSSIARAAEVLLICVGGAPADKASVGAAEEEKVYTQFRTAIESLQAMESKAAVDASSTGGEDQTQSGRGRANKRVRGKKGGGYEKLIAALVLHHQYSDGGCLNTAPIGNNKLAKTVEVAKSTASDFFEDQFHGHAKYKILCRDSAKLIAALKLLCGEFAPLLLYGNEPPEKRRDGRRSKHESDAD